MNCTDSKISKHVLFTGAGFTHNFGGYLSNTMWALIHNNLQRCSDNIKIIKILKNNFDYEYFYQKVIYGSEYNEEEKVSCLKATIEAYISLDEVIRKNNRDKEFLFNNFEEFIFKFKGEDDKIGFFFTLNQDIFIERFIIKEKNEIVLPGFDLKNLFSDRNNLCMVQAALEVPNKEKLEKKLNELKHLNYIKLHGSSNWIKKGEKILNKNILIIGTDKYNKIKKEPILSQYFDLFKKILSQESMRLLIIGYGFRDSHINDVIVDSIKKHNLKIFIIDPTYPEDFLNTTLEYGFKQNKNIIWDAISAYYPYTLNDFFPNNTNEPTQHYNNLYNEFFSR